MPWRLCGLRQLFRHKPLQLPTRQLSTCSTHWLKQCLAPSVQYLPFVARAVQVRNAKDLHAACPVRDRCVECLAVPLLPNQERIPKEGSGEDHLFSQVVEIVDSTFSSRTTRDSASKLLEDLRQCHGLLQLFTNSESVCAFAEKFADSDYPRRAYQILRLGYQVGARYKQSVYERVVFRLSKGTHWHLVTSVVILGKQHTGRSTSRLLNWRARSHVETQNFTLLDGILDQFALEDLTPSRRTFHILLQGYLRNHDVGRARSCLQAMESAGLLVGASTHAVIASAYRGLGPDEHVLTGAFGVLGSVDSRTRTSILNSLMRLYLDRNDFNGASRVLQIFNQRHLNPTNRTRTASIAQSGRKRHRGNSNAQATSPDVATYAMLIDFLSRKRDKTWVRNIFCRMRSTGILPDAMVGASLVRAYHSLGCADLAMAVVEEMCRPFNSDATMFHPLGYTPDPDTLAFGPFTEGPNAEVLNALMQCVLDTRGIEGMRHVLFIMKAANVEPDTTTLEMLLSFLESKANASPRAIARILRMLTTTKGRPTLRHTHVLLRSILRRERTQLRGIGWNNMAARLTLQRQQRQMSGPQAVAELKSFDPTAGIAVPRQLVQSSPILPILQSLAARNIKCDRATIALRMKHDAVTKLNISAANAVFQAMIARGMHPTAHHYAALMEGYAERGEMRQAAETMHRAAANDVPPNVVMHTIIIVGHARMGRPDLAMRAFQEMLSSGIEPDFAAVDAVASAFFAVKAFKLARQTPHSKF
ncbi:hypothetical protein BD410DRAFT_218476 [Rickenella mellea]|uniref:Pentacotripeptide-repeat region of PRORP domain-containing protein n=1 Tax=Rickenella mellea TaxID=50990 RepID=A0A4Y7QL79_9AGAM|nr:hypothetical protein BD410DRAFT_218476 [Rickenella mellea]